MKAKKIALSLFLSLTLVISTVVFIPMNVVQASDVAGKTEIVKSDKYLYKPDSEPIFDATTNTITSGDFKINISSGWENVSVRDGKLVIATKTASSFFVEPTDPSVFNRYLPRTYVFDMTYYADTSTVTGDYWCPETGIRGCISTGWLRPVVSVAAKGQIMDHSSAAKVWPSDGGNRVSRKRSIAVVMDDNATAGTDSTIYPYGLENTAGKWDYTDPTEDSWTEEYKRYMNVNIKAEAQSKEVVIDNIRYFDYDYYADNAELDITPSSEYSFVPQDGVNTIDFTSTNASSSAKYSLADEYTGISITDNGTMTIGTDAVPGIVKVKVTDKSVSPHSTIYNFLIKGETGISYAETNLSKTWDMSSFEGVTGVDESYANSKTRKEYKNDENMIIEACLGADVKFENGKLVYTNDASSSANVGIGITTDTASLFKTTNGATYTLAIPLKFVRGEANNGTETNWFSKILFQSQLCDTYWPSSGQNKSSLISVDMESNGACLTTGNTFHDNATDYWSDLNISGQEKVLYIVYKCGEGNAVTSTAYFNNTKFNEVTKASDASSSGDLSRFYLSINGAENKEYTLEIGDIRLYEGDVKEMSSGTKTYSINVENNTASPKTIILYGASYEGDTLTSVDFESKEITAFDKETFTVDVNVAANDTKLAYFLWEDGTLTPITGFKPINRAK